MMLTSSAYSKGHVPDVSDIKRPRGHPSLCWTDIVKQDVAIHGRSLKDTGKMAVDGDRWHDLE